MNTTLQADRSAVSGLARWSRIALVAVAWLFTLGVAVQIFLAGLALFESTDIWQDHVEIGHMIGLLAYLLPILALLGRVGRSLVVFALGIVIIYLVQVILPILDIGPISALHPLIAVLLLGGSFDLGRLSLGLVRARA